MAARDSFDQFNASLLRQDREFLRDLIKIRKAELLAARSEDARLRLIQSYIGEVHELLREVRK
jgi:hypothetical protein